MLSLSPMKVFIIVAVVVMLLGPDKLPEVARKLGSTWQSIRRFQQRIEDEVRGSLPDLPSTSDIARMARNPVNALNQLADRVGSGPDNVPSDSFETALHDPVSTPPDASSTSPHEVSVQPVDPSLN